MHPLTAGAVLPALDGASVAGIVPALLGARDRAWLPEPAREADAVVLLVLDGLGWDAVESHADVLPTIASMDGGAVTTVVPSTTATALTSITTGLAPAQHGIMGYRMLVDGAVLNVLRWSVTGGSRAPDPFDVQRHTAFLGRDVPVITRSEFRTTGFTNAHLRGGAFVGWHTATTLVEHAARCVESGRSLVYAYYPGVDTVAHEFGLHGRVYRAELAATDLLVAQMLDVLPSDAALLVTSDHGQVHLDGQSWIEVPNLAPMTRAMAGDARFRYLYARKGAQRDLLEAARAEFSDVAWVWSRAEMLELGMLGDSATGSIPGRVGDVVLAARSDVGFVDPALAHERQLKSAHGSLTAAEMYVPLVAARGRAA